MDKLFGEWADFARREIELARGEFAFLQGDETHGMFAVRAGKVQLQRHSRVGATVIIHTASAGETFAEASLFSDAYHCDAVALEPSVIVRLDRAEIRRLLVSNADFALAMTNQFATQIQRLRRKLELHSVANASERVYGGMVEGMMGADIKSFASEIGLSHEAVYRALAELVRGGRIRKIARGKYELI